MKHGKFAKRKKRAPLWYSALLVGLMGIVLFCAWHLGTYYLNSKQAAGDYEDLAALVEAARNTAPTVPRQKHAAQEDVPPAKLEDIRDQGGILLEYAPAYAVNQDLAGWLRIEGTEIDYPVMHTPDRKDYYLYRNFAGEPSDWGCLYAREECDLQEPSDNITIYGHHMKDGSMLAGLDAYRDRAFWEKHRYIRFDTLTEHHTYAIFAVFSTTASLGEGFAYHDFINAADEQDYDTFVAKCLSLSFYGTDLVPRYGDKLICLSTCEYTQTNGRLVVAAVRID